MNSGLGHIGIGLKISAFLVSVSVSLLKYWIGSYLSNTRGQPYWKMTFMEDDQNGRQLKWKTTKMYDDQDGRRPKWKATKIEGDQNGRRPNWNTTKMKDD